MYCKQKAWRISNAKELRWAVGKLVPAPFPRQDMHENSKEQFESQIQTRVGIPFVKIGLY